MPNFSQKSQSRLDTCDPSLDELFRRVVVNFDCTILEGARGAVVQMGYYHSQPRKTKLVYPLSKHNPSQIDIPEVARILSTQPNLIAITDSIVVATPQQLMKIDKLDPLEKSLAVDVIPYPVCWLFEDDLYYPGQGGPEIFKRIMQAAHNIERWFKFIGHVQGVAAEMGISLISGADWDGDNCMADQKFDDLQHFEINY